MSEGIKNEDLANFFSQSDWCVFAGNDFDDDLQIDAYEYVTEDLKESFAYDNKSDYEHDLKIVG